MDVDENATCADVCSYPPHKFLKINTEPPASPPTLTFFSSLSSDVPSEQCHPDARKYVDNFMKNKEDLCEKLYCFYNNQVFENKLPPTSNVTWNHIRKRVAGKCLCRYDNSRSNPRVAKIELSSLVLNVPERLKRTLIHEMCHAAAWIVSDYRGGHGDPWRMWVAEAQKKLPELPPITRCNSYKVSHRYTYQCVKCSFITKRHIRLDTNRKVCRYCSGSFQLAVNSVNSVNSVTVNSPPLPLPSPVSLKFSNLVERESLCKYLFSIYHTCIFYDTLPKDLEVNWNSRMTRSHGLCYYITDDSKPGERTARIELSSMVIQERNVLIDVLVQNMCLAAVWIFNGGTGRGFLWNLLMAKAHNIISEMPDECARYS